MGKRNKNVVEVVSNNNVQPVQNETKKEQKKKKLTLKDDVILNVQSIIYGKLVYINHVTGDKTTWINDKDIQQLSVGNIRAMKSNQIKFFDRNWIRIIGFAEDGFEEYTVDDIYKCLLLDRFLENSKIDIEKLILVETDRIPYYIEKLGSSFKTALIVKSNDMILNGKLDSFTLIKKVSKLLEADLINSD